MTLCFIGLIFKCGNLVDGKCKIHKKRPLICRKYPQEEIFTMGGALCEECGYKFASNTCPKCGATLPEGAKFCLECGEKI